MSALEFEEWLAVFRMEQEDIEAMRQGRRAPMGEGAALERHIQQSLSGRVR